MKIILEGEDTYSLQPNTAEETRFLTYIRNLTLSCGKPGVYLRVAGTEDGEELKPGLPERYVMKLNLKLQDTNPRPEDKPVRFPDPNAPVPPPMSSPRGRRPRGEGEFLQVG